MAPLENFGQPALRHQMNTILAQDRMPHAVLLYGEPGYGILPGALSLAIDLLCSNPQTGKACHQCPSCHRASKCIHPDLHFLLPLAGAKSLSSEYLPYWREAVAENPWLNVFEWTQYCHVDGKQVDIHKEDIMQVTAQLGLQAYEGGNKVLIIWMAQFLAKEGNRLLKMIEEPQDQTYFILVSNQREQILPTIRSRCMQLHFPPLEETEIQNILAGTYGADQSTAARVARQSVQDMNRALAVMRNSAMNFNEEMASWFRALVARKGSDLVQWSNRMGSQEKEEQKQFALYTMAFIRNILWNNAETDEVLQSAEEKEMLRYMSNHFSPDSWHPVIRSLQSGFEKIGRNANAKLLWLSLSVFVKNHLAVNRLQYINT